MKRLWQLWMNLWRGTQRPYFQIQAFEKLVRRMRAAAAKKGGKVLLTVNQATEKKPRITSLLSRWGWKATKGQSQRILSLETAGQTFKAKPLASLRLGRRKQEEKKRMREDGERGLCWKAERKHRMSEWKRHAEVKGCSWTQVIDRSGRYWRCHLGYEGL